MATDTTKAELSEFTIEQLAIVGLYALALVAACLGYGAVALVMAVMTGSLRISKAIDRLAAR